jgi:hypothetical protein
MSANTQDSNLSCKLLNLLTTITTWDRNVFCNSLNTVELIRLSICCRLLWNLIRRDNVLWKKQYNSAFLSGTYYTNEWEFVLWCARIAATTPIYQ